MSVCMHTALVTHEKYVMQTEVEKHRLLES